MWNMFLKATISDEKMADIFIKIRCLIYNFKEDPLYGICIRSRFGGLAKLMKEHSFAKNSALTRTIRILLEKLENDRDYMGRIRKIVKIESLLKSALMQTYKLPNELKTLQFVFCQIREYQSDCNFIIPKDEELDEFVSETICVANDIIYRIWETTRTKVGANEFARRWYHRESFQSNFSSILDKEKYDILRHGYLKEFRRTSDRENYDHEIRDATKRSQQQRLKDLEVAILECMKTMDPLIDHEFEIKRVELYNRNRILSDENIAVSDMDMCIRQILYPTIY